jgi:hypothetical protein
MRRRWRWVLAISAAVVALVGYLLLSGPHLQVSKDIYDRIQPGATEDDLTTLIGGPGTDVTVHPIVQHDSWVARYSRVDKITRLKQWSGWNKSIMAGFAEDGKLIYKAHFRFDPDFWAWLRRRLR